MDPIHAIMELARSTAGIEFTEAKRSLIESRLARRLRELGLDMAGYARLVQGDLVEQEVLFNALTTNHTAWLREPSHFDDLQRRVLPSLQRRQRLRIWCAATSTGEEPGTIALTIARFCGDRLSQWDAAILCTDLSTRALAVARTATWPVERVAALTREDRALALEPGDAAGATVRLRPELRRMLQFARLNLMDDWPMKGPFDVIFCRNVMIYFSRETQERLVNRMANLLAPGGTLYVGHSESLSSLRHGLTPLGPAVYRRD
jgi:chemotaxis protein methyltransferase CheR